MSQGGLGSPCGGWRRWWGVGGFGLGRVFRFFFTALGEDPQLTQVGGSDSLAPQATVQLGGLGVGGGWWWWWWGGYLKQKSTLAPVTRLKNKKKKAKKTKNFCVP